MGIQGLLPLLQPLFQNDFHVSSLRDQTVAIDASSWLHKAAYGCAWELGIGKNTTRYVDYCIHRVDMLKHYGVEPYLVFDGRRLAGKASTNEARGDAREVQLEKALQLHAEWRTARADDPRKEVLRQQTAKAFQQCSRVTWAMVSQLVKALRESNVQFTVAPYEADAQCIFLAKIGRVQGIISEDSDMLVFGVASGINVPLVTKMDMFGAGKMIRIQKPSEMAQVMEEVNATEEVEQEDTNTRKSSRKVSSKVFVSNLASFDSRMFVQMCVLAGCDYLPSLPGIKLRTAQKLIQEALDVPPFMRVRKIVSKLKKNKGKQFASCVPNGYVNDFHVAEALFYHQQVFDPRHDLLNHCTDIVQAPASELFQMMKSEVCIKRSESIVLGCTLTCLGDCHPPLPKEQLCMLARADLSPEVATSIASSSTNGSTTMKQLDHSPFEGSFVATFQPTSSSESPGTDLQGTVGTRPTPLPSILSKVIESERSRKLAELAVSVAQKSEQSGMANKAGEQSEMANKAAEQSEMASKAGEQSEMANKAGEQSEIASKAGEQSEMTNPATKQSEMADPITEQAGSKPSDSQTTIGSSQLPEPQLHETHHYAPSASTQFSELAEFQICKSSTINDYLTQEDVRNSARKLNFSRNTPPQQQKGGAQAPVAVRQLDCYTVLSDDQSNDSVLEVYHSKRAKIEQVPNNSNTNKVYQKDYHRTKNEINREKAPRKSTGLTNWLYGLKPKAK